MPEVKEYGTHLRPELFLTRVTFMNITFTNIQTKLSGYLADFPSP